MSRQKSKETRKTRQDLEQLQHNREDAEEARMALLEAQRRDAARQAGSGRKGGEEEGNADNDNNVYGDEPPPVNLHDEFDRIRHNSERLMADTERASGRFVSDASGALSRTIADAALLPHMTEVSRRLVQVQYEMLSMWLNNWSMLMNHMMAMPFAGLQNNNPPEEARNKQEAA